MIIYRMRYTSYYLRYIDSIVDRRGWYLPVVTLGWVGSGILIKSLFSFKIIQSTKRSLVRGMAKSACVLLVSGTGLRSISTMSGTCLYTVYSRRPNPNRGRHDGAATAASISHDDFSPILYTHIYI